MGDQASRDSVVVLERLTKRFAETLAVRDFSLAVARGEFFSLLGPSGCGKTTTLRIIGGFEHPDAGRVHLEGKDVTDVPPHRRPVNTVFQSYALFPHLSVFDNVAYGLRRSKVSGEQIGRRVGEMLELVDLAGFERRKPSRLSGGQQQRVALARALVNRPAVLLLDEPLGALDLKLRRQMQLELKRIQHEVGVTFIYVTHDQEEAMTMSDRIAVMRAGRADQIGAPQDVYERPATEFVAGFLGASNLLAAQIVGHEGEHAVVRLASGETIRIPAGGVNGSNWIKVGVRPEKIRLSDGNGSNGTMNAIHGILRTATFVGVNYTFAVEAAGGSTMTVFAQNLGADRLRGPGEDVTLTWRPEHTFAVEASEGASHA